MIASFGNQATSDLYHGISSARVRRLPSQLIASALYKLDVLNAVQSLDDLRSPPGNRLEALRGGGGDSDLGQWASLGVPRRAHRTNKVSVLLSSTRISRANSFGANRKALKADASKSKLIVVIVRFRVVAQSGSVFEVSPQISLPNPFEYACIVMIRHRLLDGPHGSDHLVDDRGYPWQPMYAISCCFRLQ